MPALLHTNKRGWTSISHHRENRRECHPRRYDLGAERTRCDSRTRATRSYGSFSFTLTTKKTWKVYQFGEVLSKIDTKRVFETLSKLWKAETMGMSSMSQITSNRHYLRIIALEKKEVVIQCI